MDDVAWLKQSEEPLFPDAIWSKPQQKSTAGRLLILGGYIHGFDAVGRAYEAAIESDVGEAKAAMPDKLKATLGGILPDAVYAESTPTGNLSQKSEPTIVRYLEWANGTLLIQTGDNSQTALLVGGLLRNHSEHSFIFSDDIVQLLSEDIKEHINQDHRLWILSFQGLQKLASIVGSQSAFISDMGLRPFVLALYEVHQLVGQPIVAIYEDTVVVAAEQQVTSTKRAKMPELSMLAGSLSVWWLQQPDKPLAALTSGVFEF